MHAVTIVDGELVWREHPDPSPGSGELLVAVRAVPQSAARIRSGARGDRSVRE